MSVGQLGESGDSPDGGAGFGRRVVAPDNPVASRDPVQAYATILSEYFVNHAEEALYKASLLSQRFVNEGLGPEEIIAIHAEAVDVASKGLSYRERARTSSDALKFLLEMMITYGVQYRAYLDIRLREREQDLVARLALEQQRVADAQRAETEKEEILATISHELRTPITVATGNIDLAIRGQERGRTERLPRQLTAARDALARLSRLTDDLVDASRHGLPSLELAPLDGSEILRKAVAWAAPAANEEQVTVRTEIRSACWTRAEADALLTVLGNLLSNAIRYTPAGGTVTASCGAHGERTWFSVMDTGIGMTPETQARIFEKFFRSPEARLNEPRGLGLGLSIALRLITAMEGSLAVESEPGKGSAFRVELPRTTPQLSSGESDE